MRHLKGFTSLLILAGLATAPCLAQGDGATNPASRGSILNLNAGAAIGGPKDTGPFAHRGGSLPPVIGAYQSAGMKLTSLGDDGGIRGYLVEAANGMMQTVYVTPDGEHVVAGLMFRPGGGNVTTRQVARMLRRFNDAAKTSPGADLTALPPIPEDDAGPADPGKGFVEWMRGNGMKTTPFLDRDGGLDGYLVETKSAGNAPGKMQPFYVFPDGRHAVAGVLIRRGDVFVTGLQIHALQQRYMADEAAKGQEKSSTVVTSSANPPAPPVMLGTPETPPDAKPVPAAVTPPPAAPDAPGAGAILVLPPSTPPAGAADAQAVALPEPSKGAATGPAHPVLAAERPVPAASPRVEDPSPIKPIKAQGPISPKPPEAAGAFLVDATDKGSFLDAVKDTVWFSVGAKGAPAIWMVADPQCPFCHDTWRRLKPLVFDGKLQVRIILIAGLKGSDPHVRSILARGMPVGADASKAWLEGEGSINNVPIQPPPADGTPANETAKRFVTYNAAFAQRFQVSRTPFLFYNTPEGKLYASVGIPDDVDGFLAAVH